MKGGEGGNKYGVAHHTATERGTPSVVTSTEREIPSVVTSTERGILPLSLLRRDQSSVRLKHVE